MTVNTSVAELLEEVKLRIPSDFSDSQLITILNSSISELSGVLSSECSWYSYTSKNISLYYLPPVMSFSNIISLYVDSVEYKFKNYDETLNSPSFLKISERQLALYPEPAAVKRITLRFIKSPQPVSHDSVISYDIQLIQLIKLLTMSNVAKAVFDTDTANNYISDFNNLLKQLPGNKKTFSKAYASVRDVQGKGKNYSYLFPL
nr:MAG TPA: hypothetical protein [Caudoviricetes sp.]